MKHNWKLLHTDLILQYTAYLHAVGKATARKSEQKMKTITCLPCCAHRWCAFACSTRPQVQYSDSEFTDHGFVFTQRQRGDLNPCGRSPMDFWSISVAARTHCHDALTRKTHYTLACGRKAERAKQKWELSHTYLILPYTTYLHAAGRTNKTKE